MSASSSFPASLARRRRQWEWADDVGFATDGPTTTFAGAGCPTAPGTGRCRCWPPRRATTRLRLGTLVATPNFRHPVTLGRCIALDDLSGGRLDLGTRSGQRRTSTPSCSDRSPDAGRAHVAVRGVLGILGDATADGGRRRPWAPTLRGRRSAEHARHRAASASPDRGGQRDHGAWARRHLRAPVDHHRPRSRPCTPETIWRRCGNRSRCSRWPPRPPGGRAGSRPPLGTRRAVIRRSTSSTAGGPVRRTRLRPVRAAPSGSDSPLLRRRGRRSSSSRQSVQAAATLTSCSDCSVTVR